jgi:AcrR family transcriptional regulator
MEKTKKPTARKPKGTSKGTILEAYRKTVLTEGKKPSSVFSFCENLGITEGSFYEHFSSFDAIDKEIWKGYLQQVASRLGDDSNYTAFSVREKILAFYFTLAEVLREDRSFVLYGLKQWTNPALLPGYLKAFKQDFEAWITPILNEGKQTGEVAQRPPVDRQYAALFWLHLVFILNFWSKDDSQGFEKTDVAIEKSVNLAFDVIGKGVLDNALDFGKFLYQTVR